MSLPITTVRFGQKLVRAEEVCIDLGVGTPFIFYMDNEGDCERLECGIPLNRTAVEHLEQPFDTHVDIGNGRVVLHRAQIVESEGEDILDCLPAESQQAEQQHGPW
jgi:hypothetical protein